MSEGVDEMGGHFGWSVATTVGDVVYVGAPRGCNNTGEVYKCNMAGEICKDRGIVCLT